MLEIGQIHQNEYELGEDRSVPVAVAEAPGRILLMGDQGDLSRGYLFSAAIDRYIRVAVNMRKDNSFRFFAADLKERKRSTLSNLKYRREDRWANFLKTAVFLFIEMGYPMKGLNFSFCGNIPMQIGLASSVAIETAAAVALRNLLNVQISDNDLAQKLYKAHMDFFETDASLADYEICLLARKDHFLVVDISEQEIKKVKSPLSRFSIFIVDSKVPPMNVTKEINSRKADTLKGLQFLTKKFDVAGFKDIQPADLLDVLGDFPEQIRRRTVHMVSETYRINDACEAIARGDSSALAKIIFQSHESLRDLYEISCPEIDWLVKRASETEGTAGSRMTGAGFGGCTYTIIRRDFIEEYKKRLEEYERIFGFRPVFYEVKISTGARMVPESRRG